MQFHNLKRKNPNKKRKLVGRGGTRGKTAGRGTKGQNARAGRKKRPELRDVIKRIPKLRGRGVSSLKSRHQKLVGEALKAHLAEKKAKKVGAKS
jgi:large subunit ribosomal protein L15